MPGGRSIFASSSALESNIDCISMDRKLGQLKDEMHVIKQTFMCLCVLHRIKCA